MKRLLQQFDTPFVDQDGEIYDIELYGQSRPADTWQGWLEFVRRRDGTRFETPTETTQPSSDAVIYWATGLTQAYFEGAFERAQKPLTRPAVVRTPAPLHDPSVPPSIRYERLEELERQILQSFRRRSSATMTTETLFRDLPHAHADIVRALDDLEKSRGLLKRRTLEGNDWLVLTDEGERAAR